jgi:hypothetical protein
MRPEKPICYGWCGGSPWHNRAQQQCRTEASFDRRAGLGGSEGAMMSIADRAFPPFRPGSRKGEFGLPPEALVAVTRGSGARLWDGGGGEFVDFSVGWDRRWWGMPVRRSSMP